MFRSSSKPKLQNSYPKKALCPLSQPLHSGQASILTLLTAIFPCLLLDTHVNWCLSCCPPMVFLLAGWVSLTPDLLYWLSVITVLQDWPWGQSSDPMASCMHSFFLIALTSAQTSIPASGQLHVVSVLLHLSNGTLKYYRSQTNFQTSTVKTFCATQSCSLPCSSAPGCLHLPSPPNSVGGFPI